MIHTRYNSAFSYSIKSTRENRSIFPRLRSLLRQSFIKSCQNCTIATIKKLLGLCNIPINANFFSDAKDIRHDIIAVKAGTIFLVHENSFLLIL